MPADPRGRTNAQEYDRWLWWIGRISARSFDRDRREAARAMRACLRDGAVDALAKFAGPKYCQRSLRNSASSALRL
jgi:hypothetical protein